MKCRTTFTTISTNIVKLGSRLFTFFTCVALPFAVSGATPHHLHIALSNTSEAVSWYEEHLDCEAIAGREDAVNCGNTEIEFFLAQTVGGSQGTGVDLSLIHI